MYIKGEGERKALNDCEENPGFALSLLPSVNRQEECLLWILTMMHHPTG